MANCKRGRQISYLHYAGWSNTDIYLKTASTQPTHYWRASIDVDEDYYSKKKSFRLRNASFAAPHTSQQELQSSSCAYSPKPVGLSSSLFFCSLQTGCWCTSSLLTYNPPWPAYACSELSSQSALKHERHFRMFTSQVYHLSVFSSLFSLVL